MMMNLLQMDADECVCFIFPTGKSCTNEMFRAFSCINDCGCHKCLTSVQNVVLKVKLMHKSVKRRSCLHLNMFWFVFNFGRGTGIDVDNFFRG